MPRRELPATVMPEDEARRHAYKNLQEEDEGRLPDLQAAYRVVLLPREALSRNEVFCPILQQYKTEAEATASPTEGTAGEVAASAYGGDEHARRADGCVASAAPRAGLAAALQTAVACATAQRAEGIATG